MLHIIPSYGRDYTSAAALRADWAAGKDFTVADLHSRDDGRQVNCQDYPSGPILARYARLAKVCSFRSENAAPKARTPQEKRAPAPACAEKLCTSTTRNRSGYCTRHNTPQWRAIRAGRAQRERDRAAQHDTKTREWREECLYLARLLERGEDPPRVGRSQVESYLAVQIVGAKRDQFYQLADTLERIRCGELERSAAPGALRAHAAALAPIGEV